MSDEKENTQLRLEREAFWIRELKTRTPYGLNEKLGKIDDNTIYWKLKSNNNKRKEKRKRGRHTNRTNKNEKINNVKEFIGNLYKTFNRSPKAARTEITKTFVNLSKININNILLYLSIKPSDHPIDPLMRDMLESKLSHKKNIAPKTKEYLLWIFITLRFSF